MLYNNLRHIIDAGLNVYFTFTGMSEESTNIFKQKISSMYDSKLFEDSFNIDIKQYDALKD